MPEDHQREGEEIMIDIQKIYEFEVGSNKFELRVRPPKFTENDAKRELKQPYPTNAGCYWTMVVSTAFRNGLDWNQLHHRMLKGGIFEELPEGFKCNRVLSYNIDTVRNHRYAIIVCTGENGLDPYDYQHREWSIEHFIDEVEKLSGERHEYGITRGTDSEGVFHEVVIDHVVYHYDEKNGFAIGYR